MQTQAETRLTLKDLIHLPAFAGYILNNRLLEYVNLQVLLSRKFNIPLLKAFVNFSDQQLIELSLGTSTEFLTYISQNKAEEQIEKGINNWIANRLPVLDRDDIKAEDITLLTYIRKQSFLHFIPDYCSNAEQIVELVKEIDLYCLESETRSTNTYIKLLKDRIEENVHFIEKINNTTPSAIYVFDVDKFKGIYSNNKMGEILGYSQNELNILGDNAIDDLVHPDDRDILKNRLHLLFNNPKNESISYDYRIKHKDDNYRWVRSYESVFKRHANGTVWQTIGIILDIDKEKRTADALLSSEERYKQAESLTHIGNYEWDLKTKELVWSDELFRIYGLEPQNGKIFSEMVEKFNHPDDVEKVKEQIRLSTEKDFPFDFYYRIRLKNGKEKILHARGEVIKDESNKPVKIIGTAQDVTEKQKLTDQLRQKESIYKQAEELASMGNWTWDIKNKVLEWTDQLYRMYGMEPQSEQMNMDKFLSFVHPEDRKYVSDGIDLFDKEQNIDYTFRIITKDGKTKTLRSIAKVQSDKNGNPYFVIGTERDITEKQSLIDRLQKSEELYKQAQFLAHMGNWSWDIQTNIVSWSDELYRIYGMDPHETISYDRYLSFIHTEDKDRVINQINNSSVTHQPWNFIHRIISAKGDIRIIGSTGEVLLNKEGEPYMMIGTAQDITERENLIERLQESEKHFKQAQSLAHVGNWSIDLETKEFVWSDEMYNIYEVDKPATITTKDWESYIHPDEKEEVLKYLDDCIKNKKLYDKVHRIILPSGKIKTIHRKGEFILDKEGKPVKMRGTSQDVTEEYRINQELKENQTFIRKITDATPSIIASYNVRTGKYVFISEGLEKLLGYNTKEVMEKGVGFLEKIIHPDDAYHIIEKNNEALEEANSNPDKNDLIIEFIYRMRHKKGHYRWFHTYGTIFDRNNEKKVEHVLNITLDITDQIEATEKIKEQEHFIQQIADASPTILYLFDTEKESIAYTNREIFFVLGYLPEEIIEAGSEITELLYHPDDYHLLPGRRESKKNFQQIDSMMQYECRMKNKQGEWRWLLVREIVFKTDENGKIKQILGAALDINRRKEMEKTILQNTLLLEQSNASLEEFAYVASHDLKEPLRKISTFGDRLVSTQVDTLTQEGKLYLQKIVDASQRMQIMISDLLSISMITGNRSFETFSLQKIFDETIQTLEFKIDQLNAIVKSDKLPEAKIIPSQFRQLFQNLLSNSLKFIRDGVQPIITITHKYVNKKDLAHYQVSNAEVYHKIEFSDNGIGFENEFAGKIFAIFQRLHGRSEYEGSGIGLAICKKIVEHHGGIIYANGVPDQGSTFTIILPA